MKTYVLSAAINAAAIISIEGRCLELDNDSEVSVTDLWISDHEPKIGDYYFDTGECMDKNVFESMYTENGIQPDTGLSAGSAVFGFSAWLTTREQTIAIGGTSDSSRVAYLADLFCKANSLVHCEDDWQNDLIFPSEDSQNENSNDVTNDPYIQADPVDLDNVDLVDAVADESTDESTDESISESIDESVEES